MYALQGRLGGVGWGWERVFPTSNQLPGGVGEFAADPDEAAEMLESFLGDGRK